MNLLSIAGAYGVLVAVFQWGWGSQLLGLEGPTPITSLIIVIMFPILFGLSMDYEVFLLSRVREEYVRTGDNAESVARGLAGTGRVITSAALIMIAVFLSFVASPVPSLKMLGLGLAVAILIDATLVRMVLVPATMALLGKANWWLPAWLDRALPHLTIEGSADEDVGKPPRSTSSWVADLPRPVRRPRHRVRGPADGHVRAAHSLSRIANSSSLPQAPLKKTFSWKCASRRNPTRSSIAAAASLSASVTA